MKKYLFFSAFVIIALFFVSCNNGKVTFYINDTAKTTIKSTYNINVPFNIPVGSISSNNTNEYQNNNTAPDLIESVSLEKLDLTITNPANEDFSFLKSIHIYIKKSDDSDKKEIAYMDDINSSAQSISLTCTKENLVTYLRDSTYKLDTKYTIREVPGHDIDLRIDLKFKVVASILK